MATPVRGGAGKAPSASALASTRLAPFTHWLSSAACRSPRSAVGLAVLVVLSAGAQAQSQATDPQEKRLSEVTVSGKQDGSALPALAPGAQVAKGAALGLLGNVDVMDAAFNITAYSEELIRDQNAATLAAVLENDSSVRFTTNTGHVNENYVIRGFDVNASEVAFNGLYGLAPDSHVPTEMIERVELLKGPGALLGGMAPNGAVGGVVNVVSKKPLAEDLTRLTTTFTSGSQLQEHVDVSRRFGPERRLGIRFNGALSSGQTEVDDQKRRRRLGAVALDYQGDRFTLGLDAYHYKVNLDNGSPVMVSFGKMKNLIGAPDASNNLFRGVNTEVENKSVALRGTFELSDSWQLYGSLGKAWHDYAGQPTGTRVVLNAVGDGSAVGQTYNLQGYTNSTALDAGLRGRFKTGDVGHQLVFSFNELQQQSGRALPIVVSSSYTTNIYDPVLPVLAGPRNAVRQENDNVIRSLAVADTLSLLQDRLQLTLGARHQRVNQKMKGYDESAVTPMLGLVAKPWGEDLSFYANYIEGLSPGLEVGSTYANAGETFAPYKSKQMEAGVKWRRAGWTNTLSLFQIEKPSTTIDTAANTLKLNGEQRNRGVEWNTFGALSSSLRVLGGITYLQPKLTSTQGGSNDGHDAFGAARWAANLAADWDVPGVAGLALNARLVHTGKQWVNSANTLRAPSWTRFDVGARYTTRVADKKVVLRGTVDNVFGRNYWAGAFADNFLIVGAPRTVRISAAVDF